MTLFEYMSVAISIIVALTIAEGLGGLQSALNSTRRYNIHVTWIFIKLANPIFYWWGAWGLKDIPEVWNMGTFTYSLIMPSIMYLQIRSLVTKNPDLITDWRTHFYIQRRWFFGLNALLAIFAVVRFTNFFMPAPPGLVPITGYTLIFLMSIAGFISDNARLHTIIALTVATFTFFYWWIVTFHPPSFA